MSRNKKPAIKRPLDRYDWDFSKCEPQKWKYCWDYEFARHVPWVCKQYRELKSRQPKPELSRGDYGFWGFDSNGNLHLEEVLQDENDEILSIVTLQLPPGFPKKPYLACQHEPPPGSDVRNYPSVQSTSLVDFERLATIDPYRVGLHIDWNYPNKRLRDDFVRWLKEINPNRPMRPRENRGKNLKEKWQADLKALGAYRLLKSFSVEEAIRYTEKLLPNSEALFRNEIEWYRARARAKRVFSSRFGFIAE